MGKESQSYKLWTIKKTVLQMCHDRGYAVSPDELNETLEEFEEKFDDDASAKDLFILVSRDDDPTDQLCVFFEEEKVRMKHVKEHCKTMAEEKIQRAIIVCQDIGAKAKQYMAELAPEVIFEIFYESELLVNITQHELVPEHIALTPDEKEELMMKYKLKDRQMMRLRTNDPIVRYYGFERGQVIKIIRPSETAGHYITYRIVC